MAQEWFEKFREGLESKGIAKILSFKESAPGELELMVSAEDALNVLTAAKNLEGGPFDHLADLTAYDEFPKTPRYYVVYELISMLRKERLAIVCALKDDVNPSVTTATSLWSGANWLERETFDLMGINFVGHPDERRILLPESFQGHPLRKNFIFDYRQQYPQPKADAPVFNPFGHTIVETPVKEAGES